MGSLPVSQMRIVSWVREVMCLKMRVMLRKPMHFWRNSVVMSFLFCSVELTRSEGGMIGKLKASSSGDKTASKKESSISVESRYASISCSGYTVVRIGSIGGIFDGSGDGAGYVAVSGG